MRERERGFTSRGILISSHNTQQHVIMDRLLFLNAELQTRRSLWSILPSETAPPTHTQRQTQAHAYTHARSHTHTHTSCERISHCALLRFCMINTVWEPVNIHSTQITSQSSLSSWAATHTFFQGSKLKHFLRKACRKDVLANIFFQIHSHLFACPTIQLVK